MLGDNALSSLLLMVRAGPDLRRSSDSCFSEEHPQGLPCVRIAAGFLDRLRTLDCMGSGSGVAFSPLTQWQTRKVVH